VFAGVRDGLCGSHSNVNAMSKSTRSTMPVVCA
jgi:hypothetical protein